MMPEIKYIDKTSRWYGCYFTTHKGSPVFIEAQSTPMPAPTNRDIPPMDILIAFKQRFQHELSQRGVQIIEEYPEQMKCDLKPKPKSRRFMNYIAPFQGPIRGFSPTSQAMADMEKLRKAMSPAKWTLDAEAKKLLDDLAKALDPKRDKS